MAKRNDPATGYGQRRGRELALGKRQEAVQRKAVPGQVCTYGLTHLEVWPCVVERLEAAGYATVGDLAEAEPGAIERLPGIGKAKMRDLERTLAAWGVRIGEARR